MKILLKNKKKMKNSKMNFYILKIKFLNWKMFLMIMKPLNIKL